MMMKTPCVIVAIVLLLSACDKSHHHLVQGYIEGSPIYLASPYAGILKLKWIDRGVFVKKGQRLFKLDENPQAFTIQEVEAQRAQAEMTYHDLMKPKRPAEWDAIQAQIDQTDAQLVLAGLRVERMKQLYSKNAVDHDSVDVAIANFNALQQQKKQYQANLVLAQQGSRDDQIKAQQAQLRALTAKLRLAQWELAQKTIEAPRDGLVVDTYFSEGDFVPPQQPMASLLIAANTRVEFFLPAKQVSTIHLGQPIQFTCEGCHSPNQAVINYISPEVEYMPPLVYSRDNSDKLVFRIKASIDNPFDFKPGQPVMVDLLHD